MKAIAYTRFVGEVSTMRTCGVEGIVPIIDSHLPVNSDLDRAWYAMPVGTSLWDARRGASLSVIVADFLTLAETLSQLHDKGIFHRDLKPTNLLLMEGKPKLADFGLAQFPKKPDLTRSKEDLGPRWTIAPEVRRGDRRNPRRADIYSLAKTLWMFITRNEQGFEGQYHSEGALAIGPHWPKDYALNHAHYVKGHPKKT